MKQFQPTYQKRGADPAVKVMVLRMLERNNGIRDMEDLLQISRRCVLNTLCRAGKQIVITPSRLTYSSIQLDELWSYVGRRKKGKY